MRKVLCFAILTLTTGFAQTTIVSQTGTPTTFFGALSSVSWTQSSTFNNVSIAANFRNANPSAAGAAATGTAFLTTQLGAGTTTAQQIATTSISTTSTTGADVTLFSGLTLGPGTYFLVVNPTVVGGGSNGLGWSSGSVTITTASGVTANNDLASFGTVAAYPPASTFFTKGHNLLYSVVSLLGSPTAPIPALNGWGMLLIAVLLGSSGMWLVRKHARSN